MASRRWIGRGILAIAALHTLFGFVVFGNIVMALIGDGLFDAVGATPMRGAVVWFLLAGFFMATTGMVVDVMEANGLQNRLAPVGCLLLAISLLGIALMPASGFWLMLVPAFFSVRAARAA